MVRIGYGRASQFANTSKRRLGPISVPLALCTAIAFSQAGTAAALAADGAAETQQIQIEIDLPANGAVVGETPCGLYVAGRAFARFDAMLVIDTSRSTADPSGSDIDGDGVVRKANLEQSGSVVEALNTQLGDSILAAELAAARRIVEGLDPGATRLGLVTFSGEPPGSDPDRSAGHERAAAVLVEPLTHDHARIEHGLESILSQEPEGGTDMAAGLDRAMSELLRPSGDTQPDLSEKLVLLLTDGQPTLPYGPGHEADNVRAVIRSADRAALGNIRIDSFAIGPDALAGPVAALEMARRTGGSFTPVRHPRDLVAVVEEVRFAKLTEIKLRSLTRNEEAAYFRSTVDGAWAGMLNLDPGENRIEVVARAADGSAVRRNLEVRLEPGAPAPPIPAPLVAQRNLLLEECLSEVKRLRISAEQRRAERFRKDLLVEIERERARASKRAAEQRKRLEIEIEDEGDRRP